MFGSSGDRIVYSLTFEPSLRLFVSRFEQEKLRSKFQLFNNRLVPIMNTKIHGDYLSASHRNKIFKCLVKLFVEALLLSIVGELNHVLAQGLHVLLWCQIDDLILVH